MAKVLFADGVKLGEVSEWTLTERFPEKKVVLGKEIVTQKPKDQCGFVSPKPVNRKNALWIVDGKTKMVLTETNIQGGTKVTATVSERQSLK